MHQDSTVAGIEPMPTMPGISVLSSDTIQAVSEEFIVDNDEIDSQDEVETQRISEQQRVDDDEADAFIRQKRKEYIMNPEGAIRSVKQKISASSTAYLIKDAESRRIITSPRDYQVELFERAKKQNIIAVLDTGSGKTLIAVLLLRHILDQELENRAQGQPKRLAFFLVDSVTLVFQQHAVLENNLPYRIDRLYGDMNMNLKSKKLWDDTMSNSMVVVCTAEILRQCLHFSWVTMDQINLLIFDEAHHAKKNHSYARIIKDFYVPNTIKPRVFGMTASPVDVKGDVNVAAAELEALLDSQIVTASDPSLLQYSPVDSKREEVAFYEPLLDPFETPLHKKMKDLFGTNPVFRKQLVFSKEASSDLGPWCADEMWRLYLSDTRKLEGKLDRKFYAKKTLDLVGVLDKQKAQLQEAKAFLESHTFDALQPISQDKTSSMHAHLSTKVRTLHEYLRDRFRRPSSDKCIVFVKQRHTAKMLKDLFQKSEMKIPHLNCESLVGTRSDGVDPEEMRTSFHQQVVTMAKFRSDALNCLFATSVAEEGLDIPDCNLVIRFDLYDTVIQYIQSRGRARQANSRYVHMVETGNRRHTESVRNAINNEKTLRAFCQQLPADRLLSGNDYDMDYFLAKERSHRQYTDPETGAKLTYRLSLMILAEFVSSLPQNPDTSSAAVPEYVVTVESKSFTCEVMLPSNSPVRGAIGRTASTKQVAKCSAAFEACLLLRKEGHIDNRFQSTYHKQLPAMRNAHLALESKKQHGYALRTKPALWSVDLGTIPETMYMTVLSLEQPEQLSRPSQPLGLLTRYPLPELPSYNLFFAPNMHSKVLCLSSRKPVQIERTQLEMANEFTIRIFKDIFSKGYEIDLAKMPYLLVPLHSSTFDESDPLFQVDWEGLKFVQQNEQVSYNAETPMEYFKERFICDTYNGAMKYWIVDVAPQYKPLDPIPPDTKPRTGRENRKNIMEYTCSMWSKSRGFRTYNPDQPVFEAEYISLRRNFLEDWVHDPSGTSPAVPKKCFIILEPLYVSALPSKAVAMAYLFPSIIHRIESYMITMEACLHLGLDIKPELALEAMTKSSDNTDQIKEDQGNFERSTADDYERLEFLGDCFLKMATTIALFTKYPDSNEYNCHVDRMVMICNQNLLVHAIHLKIFEYIRSAGLNRRTWYPESLSLVRGKGATGKDLKEEKAKHHSHNLADKTIADVCEALIGAALLSCPPGNFGEAVKAVTCFTCDPDVVGKAGGDIVLNHVETKYSDYYDHYKQNLPVYQTSISTASQTEMARLVEQSHPYKFKYPRLLRSAFTHPSYPFATERLPCYQRLEFLGDALLDMATINFLFHSFPKKDPQWLTEHKMAMVSNLFLGMLSVSLGFHKFLLSFNGAVSKNIAEWVVEVQEARRAVEIEAENAGRSKRDYDRNYWVDLRQPPKCLPDIVESYVGAMFVDSEFDYSEVERFFDSHIKWYFSDIKMYDTYANNHPVTRLHTLLSESFGCHKMKIKTHSLTRSGDGLAPQVIAIVQIHGRVIEEDQRESGRYAKGGVAKKALKKLLGLPPREFREIYSCDCKVDVEAS